MTFEFKSDSDVEALVEKFISKTLPLPEWTHHAHLAVAIWHHTRYSEAEALCYLRSRIILYNVATGGENTPQRGYHETLTVFWSGAVRDFVNRNPTLSLSTICNQFFSSEQSSREYPFRFYSKEYLMSTHARAFWSFPDLSALPFLVG